MEVLPESLARLARGLMILLVGVWLAFLFLILVVLTVFVPVSTAMGVVILVVSVLMAIVNLVGHIYCLNVPKETAAHRLIRSTVQLDIISIFLTVLVFVLAPFHARSQPLMLVGIVYIALVVGMVSGAIFLLFARRLAEVLDSPFLSKRASLLFRGYTVLVGCYITFLVLTTLNQAGVIRMGKWGDVANAFLLVVFVLMLFGFLAWLIAYPLLLLGLRHRTLALLFPPAPSVEGSPTSEPGPTPLPAPPAPVIIAGWLKCPECGILNNKRARSCSACGWKVGTAPKI
jgi:hypothetical protein